MLDLRVDAMRMCNSSRGSSRARWYLLPMEGVEPPFTRYVSCEECDAAGRKNVTKTELLVFKSFNEHKDVRPRGVVDDRFIDIMETSPNAMFA